MTNQYTILLLSVYCFLLWSFLALTLYENFELHKSEMYSGCNHAPKLGGNQWMERIVGPRLWNYFFPMRVTR